MKCAAFPDCSRNCTGAVHDAIEGTKKRPCGSDLTLGQQSGKFGQRAFINPFRRIVQCFSP